MITGVLFEVLAKLPLNYMRTPFNTPEREMALELLQAGISWVKKGGL